jgi:pimeloyl-ACP methyl ester carboxylesterase
MIATTSGAVERIELATARGRFHALAAGDPRHPPVLVLHGFPDAPPTFAPLLTALAAGGLRAIAPWLRGYAPSVLDGPYDVDALADDVAAWADALSPDRPVRLLGHDWGALATYAACARHPARIAAAVTLAVPHPMAFVRGLDAAQLARSWYMLFFQLPGALRGSAAARDFALIDRLWRHLVAGLPAPGRAAARTARHAQRQLAGPAPILSRDDAAAPARAGTAAPARSDRRADPVPPRRGRRLHRRRRWRRRRAVFQLRLPPRRHPRRGPLPGRRGAGRHGRASHRLARRPPRTCALTAPRRASRWLDAPRGLAC